MGNKAQASIEYVIIVGFVTFFVISIILVAYIYTNVLKDKIKVNQVESFANKIVSTAESVFYAGEPSKTTLDVYLPSGVNSITITGRSIVINVSTGSTEMVKEYTSDVNITGDIDPNQGIKKLTLESKGDNVDISQ